MLVMFMVTFFYWWYGKGWEQVGLSIIPRTSGVANAFSINQLLRTLFAPWRRIITYPGASLDDRIKAWGDNLFSRTIGLVVRLLVLFAASLSIIAVSLATLVEFIIWPLLPIGIVGFIILGILS